MIEQKQEKREKQVFKLSRGGYALLAAIIAVNIFAVLALQARVMWEREIQRDLEEELIFRARQYVMAIEFYRKKNPNLFPTSLELLYEKKFLRKLYKDPMTEEGKWNVVMRPGKGGRESTSLLIVPEDMLPDYISQAMIVGVCSSSDEEGYFIYRKKKKYSEWAIYLGEQVDKEMPELKYVAKGDTAETLKDEGVGKDREIDESGREIDDSGRRIDDSGRERDDSGRGDGDE